MPLSNYTAKTLRAESTNMNRVQQHVIVMNTNSTRPETHQEQLLENEDLIPQAHNSYQTKKNPDDWLCP